MVTGLVMLVIALTRLSFVHSIATNELSYQSQFTKELYSEADMTPEFTEQLHNHDHNGDIKKKKQEIDLKREKYVQLKKEIRNMGLKSKVAVPRQLVPDDGKKRPMHSEEVDVVDREDHVTQYLAEFLVNTDSEITSLQASEIEDERENFEVKEDTFFAFLTGQEKAVEVEGAGSRPAPDEESRNEDSLLNLLRDLQ